MTDEWVNEYKYTFCTNFLFLKNVVIICWCTIVPNSKQLAIKWTKTDCYPDWIVGSPFYIEHAIFPLWWMEMIYGFVIRLISLIFPLLLYWPRFFYRLISVGCASTSTALINKIVVIKSPKNMNKHCDKTHFGYSSCHLMFRELFNVNKTPNTIDAAFSLNPLKIIKWDSE